MSGDIEQRLRAELQGLLDDHPQIEPTQFIEGDTLITLSVSDGIPQIARGDLPTVTHYDCPHVTELQGTPVYRIYHILQSLRCLDEERLQEGTAQILARTPIEEVEGIKMENPEMPSAREIVNSTVDGDADLRNKANAYGMHRNVEALQQRYRDMLAQNPELETLILQTAGGALEIRVTEKRLAFNPTPLPGQPYTEVHETPQVRIYLLHKIIEGLEAALYGEAGPIEVVRSVHRKKAEANLIRHLQQVRCGNLVVPIRRSRKNLYLSGPAREMTYLPLRVRITGQGLCADEQSQNEPTGHTRTEYGALPADLKQLLNAFFAYLSSRMSNGSCKH